MAPVSFVAGAAQSPVRGPIVMLAVERNSARARRSGAVSAAPCVFMVPVSSVARIAGLGIRASASRNGARVLAPGRWQVAQCFSNSAAASCAHTPPAIISSAMTRIRGRITRVRWSTGSCIVRLPLLSRFLILLALSAALAQAAPRVLAVNIDSVVHPVTVEIVSRALDRAEKEHCELVLIRLNTPGGLMEAMRETIQKIVASPVPVVTYVTPSGGPAASAGVFF